MLPCLVALQIVTTCSNQVRADESPLTQFFAAVETGQVESVIKLMHPKLATQIDPPILEAWLQAISFRLGPVVEIVPENDLLNPDIQQYTARIQFKRGEALATIKVTEGGIVGFDVNSEKLTNWFQRPSSLQFYQRQGEQFLKSLHDQQYTECKNLLHKKIASQLTETHLKTYAKKLEQKVGETKSTVYRHAKLKIRPDERLQQIDLFYEIKGSQGAVQAEIAIRFDGMKGYLIGFQFYDTPKK